MVMYFARSGNKLQALLRLAVLALLLATGLIRPVLAQEPNEIRVTQLRVQVMPEFDDPRVLVLVQGRLDIDETQSSVNITVRVPRGAQINQMASMNVTSEATESQPYSVAQDPDNADWTLVTYALQSAHFFYEYYYDPLVVEGDRKSFTYEFAMPYAVDDLIIEIQQPLKASDFTLDPAPTIARFDENFGLTYHQYALSSVAAGSVTSIAVSYIKSNPEPSITREQLMAQQETTTEGSQPGASGDSAVARNNLAMWVILGVIGVALAGILGWSVGRKGEKKGTPLPEGKQRSSQSERNSQDTAYCPACGSKLKPDARFCHSCGASVRTS